jgi:hypothetical protein
MASMQQALLTGTPAVVSPASLSNMTIWLDSTISGVLFTAQDGIEVTTDGTNVKLWASTASIARCSYNGTLSWSPVLKTNIVNGKSILRFDGTDDYYDTYELTGSNHAGPSGCNLSDLWTTTAKTVVFAGSITSAPTDGGGPDNARVIGDAGNNGLMIGNNDSTHVNFHMYSYSGGNHSADIVVPKNQFVIVSAKHDGSTLSIRLNHGSWSTASCGTSATMSNLGGINQSYSGKMWGGDLAHLITYNVAHSDADIYLVEQYLAAQLGITLS